MRDHTVDGSAAPIVCGIPMTNEIRLENDALSRPDKVTDWIPFVLTKMLCIETQTKERPPARRRRLRSSGPHMPLRLTVERLPDSSFRDPEGALSP